MSETTKRTSHLTPFYLPSPDMADSAEWDLWERLHRDVPPRPSTFAAEGGAERETTNSPAEIGTGCTGRKMGPVTVAFAVMAACMLLLFFDLGLALGLLTFAWCAASGYLLGKFWVVPIVEAKRLARLRASGGEGV